MLELEETVKLLKSLQNKLQDLGESLWHWRIGKKVKITRRGNFTRKFLAKCKKI